MKAQTVLPADTERQCDCCHRHHRQLIFNGTYWLGKTCAEDLWMYNLTKGNKNSPLWRGWESKFNKVHAMVTANNLPDSHAE